jgi:hypothetical protein
MDISWILFWGINMQSVTILFFYGLLKFIAYTAWCYAALRWFDNKVKNKKSIAALLGFIRLLLGIVLGTLLAKVTFLLVLGSGSILKGYFIIYPAIRVFEWGILWLIMRTRKISITAPNKTAILLWILGGIIVSCLADLPLYLWALWSGAMLSGRFFC